MSLSNLHLVRCLVISAIATCIAMAQPSLPPRNASPPSPPAPPPRSSRPPLIRSPNPPRPPSPPGGVTCSASTVNSYLAAAQTSINAALAANASAVKSTDTVTNVWNTMGPFDICSWKGTKKVDTTITGYRAIQLNTLNASNVVCTTLSRTVTATINFGVAFTAPLTVQQQFNWDAEWCPELLPTHQTQVYDIHGTISNIVAYGSANATMSINATTICLTSLAANPVTVSYADLSAQISLVVIGTIDLTDKAKSKLNDIIPKVEMAIETAINGAKVPICRALTS